MQYELRTATYDDYEFLYSLLVSTMKEYVDQTWGWIESDQQRRFQQKFVPEHYQIIVHGHVNVGMVSVKRGDDEVCLDEIQVLPIWQRNGLGTAIVRDLITVAQEVRLPIVLQVLKVNPARRFYDRLGFQVTGETDTHFQMKLAADEA